jgi:small-conductance mechanosensitive channel
VAYQINAYTDQSHRMARIYSELHQNIQDKFNEGGVEIMSPHYQTLRDGSMTTIPSNYLPPDYKQPPFNVEVKKSEQ